MYYRSIVSILLFIIINVSTVCSVISAEPREHWLCSGKADDIPLL